MNDKPDITDHLLTKLAGEGAFERGDEYYHHGVVEELKIRGNRITAKVEGSELYQVKLSYTQKALEGSCDCPASDGIDFCKHCVAVAMTLRDQLAEPVVKKGSKPIEIIIAYLQKYSKDQVVAQLAQLINEDKILRQEWLIKAENSLGLLDNKTIRKRITAAIPYNRNCYRYSQVRQYFASIEQTVEQLDEPIRRLPAKDQIELLDYAFERIEKAQDTVDDSGGFRFDAIGQLQAIYFEAFGKLESSDDSKANYLLKLLLTDDNVHGEIPADYSEFVSDDCLTLFGEKVQDRWDSLPKLSSDDWGIKREYYSLQRFLEVIPKAKNDVAALIALYEKTATLPHNYLRLAEWHVELNAFDKAQACVDQAKVMGGLSSVDTFKIQKTILLQSGKPKEALSLQWQQFQSSPNLKGFNALKELEKQADSKEGWEEKAIDWLSEQIHKHTDNFGKQRVLTPLMTIYLSEYKTELAWELASKYSFDSTLLVNLAKQLHYDLERATFIYTNIIDHKVGLTGNTYYQEAIALLKELNALSDTSAHQKTMSQLLQQVRVKFKAKRNFIKWLNEAFPVKDITHQSTLHSV